MRNQDSVYSGIQDAIIVIETIPQEDVDFI